MTSRLLRSNTGENSLARAKGCQRTFLPLDDIATIPNAADLFAVWQAARRDGELPAKSIVDPVALKPNTLSHLILMDVEKETGRIRYRLTGTAVDRVQNRNLTGHYVDENRPLELRDILLSDLSKLARDWEPQLAEMRFQNRTGHSRRVRVLRLALSAIDGPANEVAHFVLVFDAT